MKRAATKNQLAGLILPETELYICSLMDCSAYFAYDTFRNILFDWSKNGQNLTGVNLDPTFVYENSYPFLEADGVDDYFKIDSSNSNHLNFGTNNFSGTVSINIGTSTSAMLIFAKTRISGWNYYLYIELGGKPKVGFSDGTNYYVLQANTAINDNNYHYITFVRSNQAVSIYIDGIKDVENSTLLPTSTNINADGLFVIWAQYLGIPYFKGNLGELRIDSKALSAKEIEYIHKNGITARLI